MPSISSEINQDSDDLDEPLYMQKSPGASPINSPNSHERPSISFPPPTPDTANHDSPMHSPPSYSLSEQRLSEHTNSTYPPLIDEKQGRRRISSILDMMLLDQPKEDPQPLVATSITYQAPAPVERAKSPSAGSIDAFDFQ